MSHKSSTFTVLFRICLLHVDIFVRGQVGDQPESERKISQPPTRDNWLEIHAGLEYILVVDLFRLGRKQSQYIYSPKFPKPKDEGWFLTLGCVEDQELFAMKRLGYRGNKSSHQLFFTAPQKKGRVVLTLYLMSDGYIGWDQQFNLQFEVTKPPRAVNDIDDYEYIKKKYERVYE